MTTNLVNSAVPIYPGGIDACLAILGLGATPMSPPSIRLIELFKGEPAMIQYLKSIADLGRSPEIKSKTAVFFDITAEPSRELYAKVHEYVIFGAGDFRNDTKTSGQLISDWVYDNTGLRFVVNPDALRVAYMIVMNTLWFKDTWVSQFKPEETKPLPFNASTGVVTVPTMGKVGKTDFYDKDGLVGVKLAFTNGAIAEFMMGLPATDPFVETYTYTNDKVVLYLPKFEHKAEHDISAELVAWGLSGLQEPGNLKRLAGNPAVAVGQAKQFIYVRFDELGAEVKALTYIALGIPAIEAPPRTIHFDRPFHYRIVKNNITLVHGYYDGQ